MKFETVRDISLPKIGFGTWSIGGGSRADPSKDAKSLAALRSALELGYTHFDTAEMYAAGHCEELIGQALKDTRTPRERVFITSKVSPEHLVGDQIRKSCEASLHRLDIDYIDLYLIHWPRLGMRLEDSFNHLNQLVTAGKVRYLGVSNFNLKLLKQAQAASESPILTNQVPYSLADRSYVKNGLLDYCQQNDILLTAYSPLDQGGFRSNQILDKIAGSQGATVEQIALTWLTSQRRVITIPMSFDPVHQRENLSSVELSLSDEQIKQLNGL